MFILEIVILSFVLMLVAAVAGARLGLVDIPDERKRHVGSIPLTGGIAIFGTLAISGMTPADNPFGGAVLVVGMAVFSAGLFGDVRHIKASTRLLLHYGSGIALAWYAGIAIHNVGNLLALGDIPLLFMAVPLTALSVAGLSNAYNMIDGIDGLAAATAGLPLLVLYALALESGHPQAAAMLPVLVATGMFLLFNLGPGTRWLPRVFLGDNGSVTLGFLVTVALVYFSQVPNVLIKPVTALWLVTLPLMDMLSTMLRRYVRGRPLMAADRSHVHHILTDHGLSARKALGILVAWSTLCAFTGLALEAVPAYLSLLAYCGLFIGHCLFVLNAGTVIPQARSGGAGMAAETLQDKA